MHENFARIHPTLRVTPGLAAGVADHACEIGEIVDLFGQRFPEDCQCMARFATIVAVKTKRGHRTAQLALTIVGLAVNLFELFAHTKPMRPR